MQQAQDFEPKQQRAFFQLLRISQAMGLLKCVGQGKFSTFKVAFHPFISTAAYHQHLARLHQAWHRVLFKVAQDKQFLIDLFQAIAEGDVLLKGVLNIVRKRESGALRDGVCLDRIDYYNNEEGEPKLTEFNLQCVGMMSHMQRFQDAKRLLDGPNGYVSSPSIGNFAHTVRQLVDLKRKEGVFLFVIDTDVNVVQDSNYLDQGRLEVELRMKGFEVIRTNLQKMSEELTLKENGDLYFAEEKVAVVYLRGVYRVSHYLFGQGYDIQRSWQAREKVALSNAISIPPIEFQLVNQKRVQTELGKPEVLKRYASEEDAALIIKTRVNEWEFDTMSQEELSALIAKVQVDPSGYLLKPNMEGGGNNLFGQAIVQTMRGNRQILRSYVLMQKIRTKPVSNVVIDGHNFKVQDCQYQISRYGSLSWANGQIVRNQADGFLIRAKPPTANEGGIMAGVGSIVTWKVTE